jgi:predicted Zn finger-like uncharacterized protein
MNLVTRCPGCATAFRVEPGQLAARSGQVRCGKCNTVFDGIAALVDGAGAAKRVEPPPAKASEPPPPKASEPPPPKSAEPSPPKVVEPPPRQLEVEDVPLPEFLAEPVAPRRALWPSLAALAAVILVAQVVLYFRSELATGVPASRDTLETACRLLGCELRLPRQVKLLSIDSYDVHPDPRREGVIVLNAVIRNRAPFPQEYPALHLTLTDEEDRPLVSRSVLPREYLEPARFAELVKRGLEAGGEAALILHFDASRSRATGYELVLFYPS